MAASASLRHALPVLLLAAFGPLGTASAADTVPVRAASAPAGRMPLLTPAQLRECVNQKERLRSQTDDALKDKATIETEKAEISRSGTSLSEELPTLDRTSYPAVDAYNAKVELRDKLIESYQGHVTAYNVKAEAVKVIQESYEKSCEARRYDERDLNDLKRKK